MKEYLIWHLQNVRGYGLMRRGVLSILEMQEKHCLRL